MNNNILNPPKEIFNDVNYFVTGSRRFKTNKEDSDLDICVCIDSIDAIMNRVIDSPYVLNKDKKNNKKIIYSNYNNGIKFNYITTEINVIPLHPFDYVCWFHAANLMDVTPQKQKTSKQKLHGIHETYVGMMKTYFNNCDIGIENYLEYCKEE